MRRLVLSCHGVTIYTDGTLVSVQTEVSSLLLRGGPEALRLLGDAVMRAADKLERELPVHPEAAEYERAARAAGAIES